MQSTLTFPKPGDDPHDVVMVAPDAVQVAPSDVAVSDDEIAGLLQQAARQLAETPTRAAPDFAAAPTVPPVDTTFRPTAVDGVAVSGTRRSMARRATRASVTLLLAACIGAAAFAWRSQSDAAKQVIAQWVPPLVAASPSTEKPGPAAPPAAPAVVQADANVQADTNAATPPPAPPTPQPAMPAAQSAPPAPTVTEAAAPAAAPAPDTAQLQSMARDLASLGQQVLQLKASIEQLKAGQQQISHEAAKASEQNPRARVAALPPRPPAALPPRPRRPAPYPSPQAATASTLPPPAAAPYYAPPPASPPQAAEQQLTDPELASVPRPPMPVR